MRLILELLFIFRRDEVEHRNQSSQFQLQNWLGRHHLSKSWERPPLIFHRVIFFCARARVPRASSHTHIHTTCSCVSGWCAAAASYCVMLAVHSEERWVPREWRRAAYTVYMTIRHSQHFTPTDTCSSTRDQYGAVCTQCAHREQTRPHSSTTTNDPALSRPRHSLTPPARLPVRSAN